MKIIKRCRRGGEEDATAAHPDNAQQAGHPAWAVVPCVALAILHLPARPSRRRRGTAGDYKHAEHQHHPGATHRPPAATIARDATSIRLCSDQA